MSTQRDAYTAFQEGTRLLESGNVHAAVISSEGGPCPRAEQGVGAGGPRRAYFRSGRYSAAEAEFQAAVDIDPVNDYAHFGLGLCRLKAGDRDLARGHLRARGRDAARQRRLSARVAALTA